MDSPWHLYLMAILYIIAGINHFRNPRLYLKIIPPYFPNPKFLNNISGFSEIFFGVLLCIPFLKNYAAWGIIFLLVAIFPSHIYMLQNENASLGLPKWVRILRLPLQIGLLFWAFQYTSFKN